MENFGSESVGIPSAPQRFHENDSKLDSWGVLVAAVIGGAALVAGGRRLKNKVLNEQDRRIGGLE